MNKYYESIHTYYMLKYIFLHYYIDNLKNKELVLLPTRHCDTVLSQVGQKRLEKVKDVLLM